MDSVQSYFEYLGFTLIALTHRKISIILLGVFNQTQPQTTQYFLQIIVLILTGIGATLRIYADIKNIRENKNNQNKTKK